MELVLDEDKSFRPSSQSFYFRTSFSSTFASQFFFPCLRFTSSADVLEGDGVEGWRENKTSAVLLISPTLKNCSSAFSRINFVTGRTMCEDVSALRAKTYQKDEQCAHLSIFLSFMPCSTSLSAKSVSILSTNWKGAFFSLSCPG